MKVNIVPSLIGVALGILISYGLYSFHQGDNKILLSAGSFLFITITLITAIGLRFEFPRTTINIRAVSGIFFVLALISNVIFSFINFAVPGYIIINGILLLVFILIVYSINRAKQ